MSGILKELANGAGRLFDRKNIINRAKSLNMPQIILRLFSAWVFVCLLNITLRKIPFTQFDFFKSIGLLAFLGEIVFACLVMFSLLPPKPLRIFTATEIFLYALTAAKQTSQNGDFFFFAGLCLGTAAVIFCTKTNDFGKTNIKIKKRTMWLGAVLLVVGFTVFVGGVCCMYYLNHWTSCYDFGIFAQMFHYMKETGLPMTTCERDGLLSHFAVHFSPVYYLILPFYMILPSPCTLLVMQALIVASGVIPMILICRKLGLSEFVSLCFAACLVVYPPFAGGSFTYLHENCFLTPLILWLIYFEMRNTAVWKFVFALLVLLVKEDAAVYTAVISIYFITVGITKKDKKQIISNVIIFVFTLIYFFVVTGLMQTSGEGVMSWRYSNYMYDGSDSLMTVIIACIKNPVFVISQCFTQEKIKFILQMLIPLGFLPFMSKKVSRLILFIPFVLVNLMTNYVYQYDIGFQYCFGSGSILLYLSAVNFSDMKKSAENEKNAEKIWNTRKLIICAVCSGAIIFTGIFSVRAGYREAYKESAGEREIIDKALDYIPKNASVASSTFILPNLTDREKIYQLETTKQTAEYYVLDLRYTTEEFNVNDYLNDDFEQVFLENNVIGIFRRK